MAKHAEVIYETGAKSVVAYDDDAELTAFVAEHTDRVKSGKPGSAQDWEHRTDLNDDEPHMFGIASKDASRPAERISRVLLYDQHPAEYCADCKLAVGAVQELVSGLAGDGFVDVNDLIPALRREIDPVKSGEVGPHDSMYKMPHTSELDLAGVNE